MAAPAEDRVVSIVKRLALGFALLVTIGLPLGYFGVAYTGLAFRVERQALVKAGALIELIDSTPDFWMYQELRIRELLLRFPVPLTDERATVHDAAGNSLLTVGTLPDAPALIRSSPLYDSGRVVGHVEITHSYRALLYGALVAGLLGLLLGVMVYAALLVLPLRALRRMSVALEAEQAALRESQARYERALSGANDGVWEWIPPTNKNFMSTRFKQLLGFEDHELPNARESFLNRIHPEDLARFQEAIRAHLEEREPYTLELRLQCKSGDYRWFYARGQAEWDEQGRPLRMSGSISDITERKRAEELLKTSEKRFSDIADHVREWIWEVDAEGKYTYASQVVEKILGYTREEILQKHFYDLLHPDDRESLEAGALATFAAKQPFREFINRNVHKNGQTVWLSTNGLPLLDEKGNLLGYRGADTDITERKRAEEERKRNAETLDAVMSQLTMVEEQERQAIAMDLHDHLSQILAVANIKLRLLSEPDDCGDFRRLFREAVELVEQAERSARSLSFQISPPLLFQLGLVPALESLAEELYKDYGLTILVNDDGKPKDLAPTARSVLYRATRELLINVAKHAKVNVAHVDACIDDRLLVISVTDSGVGFDKRLVEKHAPATGFGLVSMRERLRLIGGRFDIDTHPGDGTVATLAVPLAAS